MEGWREAFAPEQFIVTVGVSGMDCLAECVVVPLDEDQEFRLDAFQVRGCFAGKRALSVDGVNNGPGQRQELNDRALQRERVIGPLKLALDAFHR